MRISTLILLPAAAYQLLAIFAGLRHLRKQRSSKIKRNSEVISLALNCPGVSVLKPLRGLDPNTYQAFASQANQNFAPFEILFGVRDEADPSVPEVRRLQAEFPHASIHLIVGAPDTPNGKAGMLIELSRRARYPILVVNDSDIKVTPEYLTEVTAPLSDPHVGIVTCPYRARPHTVPAAWESLGIATDFIPSTLVAQIVGVREFGFGSTLAFRAADLSASGGFTAIADYLADDYQLAKSITSLGKHALLSTYIVETALSEATWRGVWLHQLRWARTIRLTKGAGHLGLPVTHAGLWALIASLSGAGLPAAVLIGLRCLSALITGGFVLRDRLAALLFSLAPAWDLYAFTVWLASYAGNTVQWRDKILTIDASGRIRP